MRFLRTLERNKLVSYRGLGEIYLALKDTELSNRHFKRAIELFESVGEFEGIKEIEELMNE